MNKTKEQKLLEFMKELIEDIAFAEERKVGHCWTSPEVGEFARCLLEDWQAYENDLDEEAE